MNALQTQLKELATGLKVKYRAVVEQQCIREVTEIAEFAEGKLYRDIFGVGFTRASSGKYCHARFAHVARRCVAMNQTIHHERNEEARKNNQPAVERHYEYGESDLFVSRGEKVIKEASAREAKIQADLMCDGFITKNTKKLEAIIGKDTKLKLVEGKLNNDLTGYIRFELKDGRSFRMTFDVVTKCSNRGKWFQQFPTRFHDVILKDGSRMKTPSEAKMKREF